MFGLISKLLTSVATFLFPVFASYKALKSNDTSQLTPWLMYWVVIACILVVESWVGFVLVWFPFYQEIKAGFMLWLVLPQFQGATRLYVDYIHPTLSAHEHDIENLISRTHDHLKSAGVDYLKQLIRYIEETIFGIKRAPQSQSAVATRPSNESYATSLLSRFRLSNPVAAPGTGAGNIGGLPQDFFQFLSQALTTDPSNAGQGLVAPGAGGASFLSSFSFSPFPTANPSDAQSTYLATQTERLRALLSILERQQIQASSGGAATPRSSNADTPPTPSTPESGPFGLPKNMSSSTLEDFENVLRSDATASPPPQKRTQSGGWLPWGWKSPGGAAASGGAGKASEKGKEKEHEE